MPAEVALAGARERRGGLSPPWPKPPPADQAPLTELSGFEDYLVEVVGLVSAAEPIEF